jgi:hypothetical protein
MPLFHPRVLNRHLKHSEPMPPEHEAILNAWSRNLAAGNYDSETQNDAEFIQRILIDVLGYKGSSAGDSWTVAKNQPIGSGNVDVALGNFSVANPPHIIAPFELKGARLRDLDAEMPGRHKSPVQQAWEYAMDAKGAKWVLVSNYREIRLYAVGYGRKNYETFDLATMTVEENYTRFQLLLSARNLLSERSLKLLEESEATEKDITKKLYDDYKDVRSRLIAEFMAEKNSRSASEAVELSQTILDRVLFIAFAEDKGLLKRDTLKQAFELRNPYSPQPAWENFKGLFTAIDSGNTQLNIPGYNGGLFAKNSQLESLQLSEESCKKLAQLGDYDFASDVSVNILGHIFEQSIADLEEIKSRFDPTTAVEEVGAKRRREGIFYTPAFVTHQIVEQALGRWLSEQKAQIKFDKLAPLTDKDYASIQITGRGRNTKVTFNANVQKHVKTWEAYRGRLSSIKVLDPACGSGAFLNEVFDFLYREGNAINAALETLHGGQTSIFRWDTHILQNNIYGVDINKESIEITKLSLWLKTANRNEKLSYLDDNIQTGNSLIDDESIAGQLAFNWKEKFKSVMDDGGFDIVIGNPPYVDSEAMAKFWIREREWITANYNQTRGNWDLYIAFLELGYNLLAPGGYLSFITPDKWIAKPFGIEIRKRFTPGIVSILPVGRDVFESALVDSIITTVHKGEVPTLQVLALNNGEASIVTEVAKSELNGEDGFDQLLSSHYSLIQKMERGSAGRLRDVAVCENACATSDTYILGEILEDAGSIKGYSPDKDYKVANTGTLSRYVFRWGIRPMRYLKHDYVYPIVGRKKFSTTLGATYNRRAASPKLIIKGLTLLDAALDADASFVPGKSTLVIPSKSIPDLKFIAALVNSRAVSFYVKQKYASSSYNGGVSFTPDMINGIPIPALIEKQMLIDAVDKIIAAQAKIAAVSKELLDAVRASGAPKTPLRLDNWYELNASEFVGELKRSGIGVNIRERGEWTVLLEEKQAVAIPLRKQIEEAQTVIDNAVNAGFGLTSSERSLVGL